MPFNELRLSGTQLLKLPPVAQANENMTAADGKANFVFSCGKRVKRRETPTFQGLEEFKNLQVSPGSSAQRPRVRVFARRTATAKKAQKFIVTVLQFY